jgi:hypothetical protein
MVRVAGSRDRASGVRMALRLPPQTADCSLAAVVQGGLLVRGFQ